MNIKSVIENTLSLLEKARTKLQKLPGLLLTCTCSRRPGFSSIVTSAKIYADMNYADNENDDIVKEFVYNVVNRIKMNIQDDGVCFVAIPPGELDLQLMGGNGGGPIVLKGTNKNYVFTYAIIR